MSQRAHIIANEEICPLCGAHVRALVRDHVGLDQGACTRCVDQFNVSVTKQSGSIPESLLSKISNDPLVLPTPLRLSSDPNFTGKGVTICLIDSGFYPHPDLTRPLNRITCMVDTPRVKARMRIAGTVR